MTANQKSNNYLDFLTFIANTGKEQRFEFYDHSLGPRAQHRCHCRHQWWPSVATSERHRCFRLKGRLNYCHYWTNGKNWSQNGLISALNHLKSMLWKKTIDLSLVYLKLRNIITEICISINKFYIYKSKIIFRFQWTKCHQMISILFFCRKANSIESLCRLK